MQFRDDILRGIRLFLIVFAVVLTCVAGYRMLHTPADAQIAAPQDPGADPAGSQTAAQPQQTAPESDPVANTSSEQPHGLIVPPPPPVAGEQRPVTRVSRPKGAGNSVPPPPPMPVAARSKRAVTPAAGEFETAEPGTLPAAPVEETTEAAPAAPQKGVGYKSLIDVDPNRAAIEPPHPAAGQPDDKPKGNRFTRALGKVFHPGAKKETTPQGLQPEKQ